MASSLIGMVVGRREYVFKSRDAPELFAPPKVEGCSVGSPSASQPRAALWTGTLTATTDVRLGPKPEVRPFLDHFINASAVGLHELKAFKKSRANLAADAT